ncbi:MAG: penicillin-binding protein activator [Wenzhouxiangellaceae bacterium]
MTIAACAPSGPTRPDPRPQPPTVDPAVPDDPDFQTHREMLRARVDALASEAEEPDFQPETALALLIDLPLADLEALQLEHGNRLMLAPWLDLAVTARARLLDDAALAVDLDRWRQRWDFQRGLASSLHEWLQAWRATRPVPERITVLLPGEPPLARAGEVLRDGLLARWLQMSPGSRPELDFVYTPATRDAAVGAWFDARERGSDFIIGPLARDQVGPLLDLPDSGLPILMLNRPPERIDLPEQVVPESMPIAMLALPPEEEAELAAARALVDQAERALVIEQRSDYGRRVGSRFVETFELGGGQVLDRIEYLPGEFDHTEQLSGLLRIQQSEARIERLARILGQPVESEARRRTDFDLIFLVARGGDARQIMPQLRFLDLEDAPVYATSEIWQGGRAGNDLDGIRLPVAPWLLADHPVAAERLEAETLTPELAESSVFSLLNALGRDALELVPWMLEMKRDPDLYLPGRIGRIRLADGIHFQRDLPWVRIENGRLVPDDGGR